MIHQAKTFATQAHDGHVRKITHDPYITHPIRVAERLKQYNVSDALIAAAYLHDVVEDTSVTTEDIRNHFGDHVASLVAAHTEDKTKSWRERKQQTINMLKDADKEVTYLIVADRLDNLLQFEKDKKQLGEAIWDKFNAGYEAQKWYNEQIANHMRDGLADDDIPDFFTTFENIVNRVFDY